MKRKVIKMIGIILIMLAVFNIYLSYINKSFALGDVTKNPDIWVNSEDNVGDNILNNKSRPITGIIRTFGVIASVVTLAIIALRIIFGSTEEKANYKQTLLPWAVGAVMLFSMATIPSLVYDAIENGVEEREIVVIQSQKGTAKFCINRNAMVFDTVENGNPKFKCTMGDSCGCGNEKGKFCLNGNTMKYDAKENKYVCTVGNSCGCRDRERDSGYYCKICHPDGKNVRMLRMMKVEGGKYYYCAECGNLHNNPN